MNKGFAVGLLGGSFNPAHGGHRRVSVAALGRLHLDEIWWLVSPQNPLKPEAGMAAYRARVQSCRAVARHPRIRVSTIETQFRTRRTIDTIRRLKGRFPQVRFLWLMGSDNLAQFHHWVKWRAIAREVPIVVVARPGYVGKGRMAPAMGWLGRWRRGDLACWRAWTLPAIGFADLGLDRRSATAIRQRAPDWADDDGKEQTV